MNLTPDEEQIILNRREEMKRMQADLLMKMAGGEPVWRIDFVRCGLPDVWLGKLSYVPTSIANEMFIPEEKAEEMRI